MDTLKLCNELWIGLMNHEWVLSNNSIFYMLQTYQIYGKPTKLTRSTQGTSQEVYDINDRRL